MTQIHSVEDAVQFDKFFKSLTPREREVYDLCCAGYTNKQVARQLNVSYRTVEVHRLKISEKGGSKGLRWGRCMVKASKVQP